MRFGEYLRARREFLGLSLRQFCEAHGFDPGNTSKIERGTFPPPETEELVVRYGRALALSEKSREMQELLDLAAAARGKFPQDVFEIPGLLATLPAFFRTLRVQKATVEEEAKDRFLSYLARTTGSPYITTDADVVVNKKTGRNFDFELTPINEKLPRIALEIFSLVDREAEVAASRHHNLVWAALKDELDRHQVRDFAISTPARFQLPKSAIKDYCRTVAESIKTKIDSCAEIEEFEIGPFKATRYKGLGPVVFTSRHSFCQVDPAAAAEVGFSAKLQDKEKQLPDDGHRRIILALNWVMFVRPEDATSALASMDLEFLNHTDQIFFEAAPDNFTLVYDRRVRRALEIRDDPPQDNELATLYHSWLASRIHAHDRAAFQLVREVTARKGNTAWVPDRYTREAVVWMANEMAKQGAAEDALWAARHFRHDPDPETDPPRDQSGPNLHEMVRTGERVLTISSVRGSTCWLLQRLVCLNDQELIPQILDMVEELARDDNFYVRQQVTVPLLELAARQWSKDAHGRPAMDTTSRWRVRHLAFEMLESNKEHPRVMEWVGGVFEYVRDANEIEADHILKTLRENCPRGEKDIFAWMLIYFAVYRSRQFKDLAPFDASPFRLQLTDLLRRGPVDLRRKAIWHMARVLEETPEEIVNLFPFLADVADGPYDETTFFHLFDAANSLPDNLQRHLEVVIAKASQKEMEANPQCPAAEGARLVSGF